MNIQTYGFHGCVPLHTVNAFERAVPIKCPKSDCARRAATCLERQATSEILGVTMETLRGGLKRVRNWGYDVLHVHPTVKALNILSILTGLIVLGIIVKSFFNILFLLNLWCSYKQYNGLLWWTVVMGSLYVLYAIVHFGWERIVHYLSTKDNPAMKVPGLSFRHKLQLNKAFIGITVWTLIAFGLLEWIWYSWFGENGSGTHTTPNAGAICLADSPVSSTMAENQWQNTVMLQLISGLYAIYMGFDAMSAHFNTEAAQRKMAVIK